HTPRAVCARPGRVRPATTVVRRRGRYAPAPPAEHCPAPGTGLDLGGMWGAPPPAIVRSSPRPLPAVLRGGGPGCVPGPAASDTQDLVSGEPYALHVGWGKP